MRAQDDIDTLAAEYVLGTLDASERAEVAARRSREPGLDAAIDAWEARFAPMLDAVPDAAPPEGLFPAIEAAINGAIDGAIDARASGRNGSVSDLDTLRRRLRRWRAIGIGATALAACLVGVLIVREAVLPPQTQTFVAVFQDGDTQPRFVLSVDLETRELTIRPVTAEPREDKAYELWIVGEGISPVPRSLGLLQGVASPTRKQLDGYDPALLRRATFGISLEPPGGSPTGQPTGPALHGTLIPAGD